MTHNSLFSFGAIFLSLTLLLLASCAEVDSSDVKTSGVEARFSSESSGNGRTRVQARLDVGSGGAGTNLELANGDTLTVHIGEESYPMRKDRGDLLETSYYAWVDTDLADTTIRVAFNREEDAATESYVTIPMPFTISSPHQGQYFSYRDDFTLLWNPASYTDNVSIDFVRSCAMSEGEMDSYISRKASDTGSYHVNLIEIFSWQGQYTNDCIVDINVERYRFGVIDPGYGHGGSFRASQKRDVEIIVNPHD